MKRFFKKYVSVIMAMAIMATSAAMTTAEVYANAETVRSFNWKNGYDIHAVTLEFSNDAITNRTTVASDSVIVDHNSYVNPGDWHTAFTIPVGASVTFTFLHESQDFYRITYLKKNGETVVINNPGTLPRSIQPISYVFDTSGYLIQEEIFADGSVNGLEGFLAVNVMGERSQQTPAPANDTISVTINGTAVNFTDQQPVNIGGRVLVPVRGVFEALGFEVSWNEDLKQATLVKVFHEKQAIIPIVITLDSATFTTNNAKHTLDVPAQSIGGRTMIPLRAVLESVGYVLNWDEDTQTVIISTPENQPQTPEAVETYEQILAGVSELEQEFFNLVNQDRAANGGLTALVWNEDIAKAVNFVSQQHSTMLDDGSNAYLRKIFESLGFDTSWDAAMRQFVWTRGNDIIALGNEYKKDHFYTINGVIHERSIFLYDIGDNPTVTALREVLEVLSKLDQN